MSPIFNLIMLSDAVLLAVKMLCYGIILSRALAALGVMTHKSSHRIRYAYWAMSVAALVALAGPFYGDFDVTHDEIGLGIGFALYLLFDRRCCFLQCRVKEEAIRARKTSGFVRPYLLHTAAMFGLSAVVILTHLRKWF